MVDLSAEQIELKASIHKSATIWAGVLGIILALIVYFVLGSQGTTIQLVGAVVVGALAGYGIYRWQFGAQSKSAQCNTCNAAFSITRTDRSETLVGSEDKVERAPQDDGSTEVTRFTEETYDVVDTYTCASCNDVTKKEYKTTRRENVQTKIDPAPVAPSGAAPTTNAKARGATSAAKKASPKKASKPKRSPSGPGRGGSDRS